MNEGVLRSPKWLRNIADFEINTGEDIKGEPSLSRQKKLDAEKKRKEEETREKRRQEEEARRIREEEQRKIQEEQDKKDFQEIFQQVEAYIYHHYQECEISVPKSNFFTVEKHDLKYQNKTNLEFVVTLDNTIGIPTFNVELIVGKKTYNYKVSGLNYLQLKNFFADTIYEWYKVWYKKSQQSKSQSGSQGSQSNYGSQGSQKTTSDSYKKSKPSESDEIRNKRRKYILLKDTLSGYIRQMDRIKEWEKANPGKTHPDKETTNNEIKVIKNKINFINKEYRFESRYYLKHLNSIFS